MKQVLLYLPVIHAGYEQFLQRHSDSADVMLLGAGFRERFPSLAKDIRALAPARAADYLRVTVRGPRVTVVEPAGLQAAISCDVLVMPDEQVMRDLTADYRLDSGRTVVFDRTFLRWDRNWSTAEQPVRPDSQIAADELSRTLLGLADEVSGRSSDWWRQVGAVAVRDGTVLCEAWNRHHPTEYSPYLDGDPRDAFERGVRADLSTAIHAEAAVVAQAARHGISLAGADLYVSTFPCPACARLIAEAGFRRCLFARRYSVLDGERVLRSAGVELIWVDASGPPAGPAGS
ncbi:MAG: deaminase [Streptosporangiaceae bacterium]